MTRQWIVMLALAGCAPLAGQADAEKSPPQAQTIAQAGLGGTARLGRLTVTPLRVVEDSRCPRTVDCVWAGRLRLAVRIRDRRTVSESVLELGGSHAVADGSLILVEATPYPEHGAPSRAANYRFTFGLRPAR